MHYASKLERRFRVVLLGAQAEHRQACKAKAWQMYHDGQVKALVDEQRFVGLERIPDAVDHMLSGQAIGKVVVAL